MNVSAAAAAQYAAAVTGAGIAAWWAFRARRGRDGLGPRPEGALPRTAWPFALALPVWVVLPGVVAQSAAADGASPAAVATLAALVHVVVGAALLPFVVRGAPRSTLTPGRLAATGLVAGLATFGVVGLVGNAIQQIYVLCGAAVPQQPVVEIARAAGGADWSWIVVGTVAFAPFGEEVLFRGALLPALARTMPAGRAVALQAALFGAVHVIGGPPLLWPLAVPLALVGAINGWLYLRTGSLAAPFLVHAVFNAINLTVLRTS